jgi:hypothetical protein
MKALALLLASALAACTSETEYGSCIGAFDDPNPDLIYEASTKNIVLAAIFVEMIFPPFLVILKETKCPVDVKPASMRKKTS